MIRAIAILVALAACGDDATPTPDAGPPSCASVCAPNDGPVTCDAAGCTCPNPDGSGGRVECSR